MWIPLADTGPIPGRGSQGTNRDKDLRPDRTDTRGSPVGSPILDRIDTLDNPAGMIGPDRTDTLDSPVGTPIIDRIDILDSPAETQTTDRIDIRDSPAGTTTIDRIEIPGSLAGTSPGPDTTKGLPVGDSQHHVSGLYLETGMDRGPTIDLSRSLLVDQGHPDTIPMQDKVGHPTGRTVQTGTVPCPLGTPTLS